jgi:hypothetical protein
MEVLAEHRVKSAALTVQFTWDQEVRSIRLERVAYFSDYNQTNNTEIRDQDEKIALLKSSTLESELYEYALPQIERIIQEEAKATGLGRSYGSFTYSLYDDPCRSTGYFPPTFRDPDETELMREAETHDLKTLRKLLGDARQLNLRDQYGRTPLLHASTSSHNSSMVAELLVAGADANAADFHGTTALMNASQLGELDNVQLLLSHGADINSRNDAGETALMKASVAGRSGVAIVHLLLVAGAQVNDQDAQGQTALMIAAHQDSREIVQELLNAGAKTGIRDKRNKTAVEHARDSVAGPAEQIAIIRLIERASPPH